MPTALLLIDIQKAILDGKAAPGRQSLVDAALNAMIERLEKVLSRARAAGMPVMVVQHDDILDHRLAKGSEGWQLRPELAPLESEPLVHKRFCDAFYDTPLGEVLSDAGVTRVIIGGCMSQWCIDTSVRSAVAHGYDVTLLSDGHMTGDSGSLTFDQIIAHHNATLDGFDAGTHSVRLARCDEIVF